MSGAWNRISRLTGTVVGQAQALRDKARELREEVRTSDEPERLLVAPLVPGQHVRYVGLVPVVVAEFHGQGRKLADEMAKGFAESFDPRVLFGLLNIVNPLVWVDAVIAPVRMVAGLAALPAQAAVAGGLAAAGQDTRPVAGEPAASPRQVPLTPEQEAFRALFRFDRDRPLAEQLAAIAYERRYVFSGNLDSLAGSLLLFLERYRDTPIAVTDTHLHLLDLPDPPPADEPDHRRPRVLWSVDRRRVARIDLDYGATRLLMFPMVVVFDDGSWIRIVNPIHREDQNRLLTALDGVPVNGRR